MVRKQVVNFLKEQNIYPCEQGSYRILISVLYDKFVTSGYSNIGVKSFSKEMTRLGFKQVRSAAGNNLVYSQQYEFSEDFDKKAMTVQDIFEGNGISFVEGRRITISLHLFHKWINSATTMDLSMVELLRELDDLGYYVFAIGGRNYVRIKYQPALKCTFTDFLEEESGCVID